MKIFAKNLRLLIGEMSVSEFARKVDIPQQTISRYLLCQREISLTNLCKIADYFNEDIDFLIKYWTCIFEYISEWNQLENKEIHKKTLREEYILTLGVTLNAFGRLGKFYLDSATPLNTLAELNKIDWLRVNPEWQGRLINSQGKIINNEDAIIKICNYFKSVIGLELTKEERSKEDGIRR